MILNQLYAAVPDSSTVGHLRASLEIQDYDLQLARETMKELLARSDGKDVIALGTLGSLSLIEGGADEAVSYFEQLLEMQPDNKQAQAKLLEAKGLRGDFIARDLAAAQVGTVKPDEVFPALVSASSAFKQGRHNEAMANCQQPSQTVPRKNGPPDVDSGRPNASGRHSVRPRDIGKGVGDRPHGGFCG